jgi:hypothetical protein
VTERARSKDPPALNANSPTAYLRVALTYMLISMPQGTSTIFGVFQAILALHFREFGRIRPRVKVMRVEKFASEIFPRSPCCAAKNEGGTAVQATQRCARRIR